MSDRTAVTRPPPVRRGTPRAVAVSVALLVACLVAKTTQTTVAQETKPPDAQDEHPNSKLSQPSAPDAAPDEKPYGSEGGITVAAGVEAGMREAFAQLADADADVREAARLRLMSLERRYLPALQKLVERNRPLLPAQATVIRQIVTHVYLSAEPYSANGNLGFLGVKMADADLTQDRPQRPGAGDGEAQGGEEEPEPEPLIGPDGWPLSPYPQGIVIVERMPGFAGHRALLDGDVVVGLADRPGQPFHGHAQFSAAVKGARAGGQVRFTVLRRGRLTTVEVKVDARPDVADHPNFMNDLILRRREKAEAYWNESFGPLLNERVG